MRTALVADIHGNLAALDAVLADLERRPVEELLCLGDVAALGPQPSGVISRLRELDIACVLGNTDAWMLDGPPTDPTSPEDIAMAGISRWCASRLSGRDLDYLRACPLTLKANLGGDTDLLCFHGSPRSYDGVISATTPGKLLSNMLAGYGASAFAGGHAHVQLFRRLGDACVLNPGSVGLPGVGPGTPDLPVNSRVSWAEYAILTTGEGILSVELRRVPINPDLLLAPAREGGMPYADWWLGKWEATELG